MIEIARREERLAVSDHMTEKALLELLSNTRPWVREMAITLVGKMGSQTELAKTEEPRPERRGRQRP